MDSVSYSQERFREIEAEMNLLMKRFSIKNYTLIPGIFNFLSCLFSVSAWTGENLIYTLAPSMPWYKGPTLCQAIDNLTVKVPKENPLRLCVSDVFKINGEPVIIGKKNCWHRLRKN